VSVASGSTFRPSQTATPRATTRGSSTRQGLQLKLCPFRAVAYPQAQDVAFSRYRDTDHHIDRLVADRSSWTLTPIALMKITGYDRRARVMRWGPTCVAERLKRRLFVTERCGSWWLPS
jgi:hypothetical protein